MSYLLFLVIVSFQWLTRDQSFQILIIGRMEILTQFRKAELYDSKRKLVEIISPIDEFVFFGRFHNDQTLKMCQVLKEKKFVNS